MVEVHVKVIIIKPVTIIIVIITVSHDNQQQTTNAKVFCSDSNMVPFLL